ncbi:MAG TPA: hypothetical protein VLA43_02965, partial [Longimicrobiales bacterium]|nr:hypothetical protein [Longimicrobiales bacterium]
MTLSESWQPLDIDTPDAVPLPRPGSDVHVVALVATAAARRDGWGARAALEIARGWGAEGARVVLCDLDLETPALHGAAGLDNLEGISDALLFGTSFQRMAQPLSDGLYIATAGTAVPNGEALRTHPRWRAFAEGFSEAGAVMALYLPEEAPGTDALLELCHTAVILGAKDEVGAVTLPGRMPVLAVAGPEGLVATRGAAPLDAAEASEVEPQPEPLSGGLERHAAPDLDAGAPGDVWEEPAETDPFWAMDVEVDAQPAEGESRLLEAEAGSTPEIPLAASLESLELMDAE